MVSNADTVYVMVDYSKFGLRAFTRFSDLDSIDYVITDSQVDQAIVQQLSERFLKVIKTEYDCSNGR